MRSSKNNGKYLDSQNVENNENAEAAIARQVKYNTFIRDYFRDPKSEGKKLQDAIDEWNNKSNGTTG